jgi:hypothetical protein
MDQTLLDNANALLNLLLLHVRNETVLIDVERLRSNIEIYKRNSTPENKNTLTTNKDEICKKYNIDEQVMKYAKILLRIQEKLLDCNERNNQMNSDTKNRAKALHDEMCRAISQNYNHLKTMIQTNQVDMNVIYNLYNSVLYTSNLQKSVFELSDNDTNTFESEYSNYIKKFTQDYNVNDQAIRENRFIFGGKNKKISRNSRRNKSHKKSKRKSSYKRSKRYSK